MCTKLFSIFLLTLPVLTAWVAMSYKSVKAWKQRGRCTVTHDHLYVGILSIDISFREVREILQIQDKSPRPIFVDVTASAWRPRQGGGPMGKATLRTRPPGAFRSQLAQWAAFCVYDVLPKGRKDNILLVYWFVKPWNKTVLLSFKRQVWVRKTTSEFVAWHLHIQQY